MFATINGSSFNRVTIDVEGTQYVIHNSIPDLNSVIDLAHVKILGYSNAIT